MGDEEPRTIKKLKKGWRFIRSDVSGAEKADFDHSGWGTVDVPHDWAIEGPFDVNHDTQLTAIEADGEAQKREHTGRTGGLPHIGKAWYRLSFDLTAEEATKKVSVEFDGVMSHSRVYCNGRFAGNWPYGYASFSIDLTPFIQEGKNILSVSVDNKGLASRWYPGAGIYRNVRLVLTEAVHIAHWGTYITTPDVSPDAADVRVRTTVVNENPEPVEVALTTTVRNQDGQDIAESSAVRIVERSATFTQDFAVNQPDLWDIDGPNLYQAESKVKAGGEFVDSYVTPFGIRSLVFDPWEGFFLNEKPVKLKGVCQHHDLGPLGSAVNKAALQRQLTTLQEMGCNAIRTSHNPPTPELLDLCDSMGFVVIDEAFDEWRVAKVENGYHTIFDEWAERDLRAMIRRDRNHPSIIMWSIGNEIGDQKLKEGYKTARFLTDICHNEDPTRPTTAGFNRPEDAMANGVAEEVDIPGWNYEPHQYMKFKSLHPDWTMYGSETESCVSTRGEYYFLPEEERDVVRESLQVSSYDLSAPNWAYCPDLEFRAQDECPFILGEFVWTGWDYLGEPTPHKVEWPSRSSYFGIIDLCGIPKDRFYLYQSKWTDRAVLHLLPHWTWPGRDGELTPVHCYTSFDSAELFVNGKSLGVRQKRIKSLTERYRLIWNNVRYEPGELKAVAYDTDGNVAAESIVMTAGNAQKILLTPDREQITAVEESMAFVHVGIVDKDGHLCPHAENKVEFSMEGPAEIAAVGNGDPSSLDPFKAEWRKAFHGECMVYLLTRTGDKGQIRLRAASEGLEGAECTLNIEPRNRTNATNHQPANRWTRLNEKAIDRQQHPGTPQPSTLHWRWGKRPTLTHLPSSVWTAHGSSPKEERKQKGSNTRGRIRSWPVCREAFIQPFTRTNGCRIRPAGQIKK